MEKFDAGLGCRNCDPAVARQECHEQLACLQHVAQKQSRLTYLPWQLATRSHSCNVYKSSKKVEASEPSCLSVPHRAARHLSHRLPRLHPHLHPYPHHRLHSSQLATRTGHQCYFRIQCSCHRATQHTPAPAPTIAPYGCSVGVTLIAVVFLKRRAMSQNFTACTFSCEHGASNFSSHEYAGAVAQHIFKCSPDHTREQPGKWAAHVRRQSCTGTRPGTSLHLAPA